MTAVHTPQLAAILTLASLAACVPTRPRTDAAAPSPAEARAIAKDAYVYGFPLVDGYRILHAYCLNPSHPEYKAPFNTLKNIPRVYTPEDKAVQTPNSDTPYSMLVMDLRREPLVLTVPPIEKKRYFSIQLIDAYTFNFDYIGSRTTGNGGGKYLVAGPAWQGETPAGIDKVIRSETDLTLAVYRTQLFDPEDLDEVKTVQAGYLAQPLSAFLGKAAPPAPPEIAFVAPLSPEDQKTSLEFFNVLSFVLRFCPPHPSEKELLARFASIGVGAGKHLDVAALAPQMRQALADGMADAWKELGTFEAEQMTTGKVTSGDLFGTREFLRNNYLYRFAAAKLGIYGNSKLEAMYPFYSVDASGQKLDGAKHRYTLRFPKGQLPPVHAFWSLTMYGLPASLLVANPLDRYLINSPMLPDLKRDADGGLTLYLQSESPGSDEEANWLPAPKGPFLAVLRLYWPKEEALTGAWQAPKLQRAD